MDSTIELQKQIKDNAEDVRRFVSELGNWEEEMKRKEVQQCTPSKNILSVPPVRNTTKKRESSLSDQANVPGKTQGVKKRISSSNYAAWEKFDVERACHEIDSSDERQIEKSEECEEEKQIREKRLRDEANVEKEKGNHFVKKEKWDCAIQSYSRAIKCYSRDAIFYCNRALCFLKKKDYRAAETDCTSALALDRTYVKALHRRGLARKELGQLVEAEADFRQAHELNPDNSAILRDYTNLQSKIVASDVLAENIPSRTDVILAINVEKKADPILPAKKYRPSSTSQKETREISTLPQWPKLEDCAVIKPVSIPPHKRSKKPLQRIRITEEGNDAITPAKTPFPISSSMQSSLNKVNVQSLKTDYDLKKIGEHADLKAHKNTELIASSTITQPPRGQLPVAHSTSSGVVPATPKNSVQFLAGWRQIMGDANMCFKYLKQIRGEDLPRIFQDSLDGHLLSQILKVLLTKFVPANEPVLGYLQGLSQVPRFRTLILFLSQSEKEGMSSLFEYLENQEKVSLDVIVNLKKEYEL